MATGNGCAKGPCDRSTIHGGPGCYLCDVIARLPQNTHPTEVQRGKATRDGAPKLAGERKRGIVRRSKRAGPMYVPPARRV